MAKITIDLDDVKDGSMIKDIFDIVLNHKEMTEKKEEKKEEICVIPSTDPKQSEAQRIAERQQYCICLINSAKKVLENLQFELAKESPESGRMARSVYAQLTGTMDQYLYDSRKLLSKEVNKAEAHREYDDRSWTDMRN